MKYRYIEFTDRTAVNAKNRKNGSLYYVGKPSEELISTLELETVSLNGGFIVYKTTLDAIGGKGWELQFVTPCGMNLVRHDSIGGPIENTYIFRKCED